MKGSRKGYFKLKDLQSLHLKEVIAKLKEKNQKLKNLDAAGRWNRLVQMMLIRIKNIQESRTLKRWHKLILKASRLGKVNLMKLGDLDLKTILQKLQEKDKKVKGLQIRGRWNSLINGVLGNSQNRCSQTQQRWVKLVLRCSRKGHFRLKDFQSLRFK